MDENLIMNFTSQKIYFKIMNKILCEIIPKEIIRIKINSIATNLSNKIKIIKLKVLIYLNKKMNKTIKNIKKFLIQLSKKK